jgi:hypothetical protein
MIKEIFENFINETSKKKIIYHAIIFSIVIYVCWLVRILFLIKIPALNTEYYTLLRNAFGNFNWIFMVYFLVFLILDVILFAITIFLISGIVYILMKLLKRKIDLWTCIKIVVYSTIPYIFSIFIFIFMTILNIAEYQMYISYASYLCGILIIIYGLRINYLKN